MIRFFLVFGLLASLCMIGQRLVVSGEAVLANHRATIETIDAQLNAR